MGRLFMFLGGFEFSFIFSRAIAQVRLCAACMHALMWKLQFTDGPSQARTATVMNIVYYMSMGLSISLALIT